ncbi:hypothetical protein [Limimaricola sp. AA108-03]|uniref:hypothetical protein n=1 Tax=Limimaricola sp. AA108-03 TaxID=3425945 RepID=UPI003D78524B
MHPPFYIIDHRAQPDSLAPWEERPRVRRGGPARLDLEMPHTGTGLALLRTAKDDPPAARATAGGIWPRLRALVSRRPMTEPVR